MGECPDLAEAHVALGRVKTTFDWDWRGAEEAGAVFVKVATLDGNAMLYVPAPQTVYDDSRPIDRFFVPIAKEALPEAAVEDRLTKEIRFDPDAWIVETEDKAGRHFLDLAAA